MTWSRKQYVSRTLWMGIEDGQESRFTRDLLMGSVTHSLHGISLFATHSPVFANGVMIAVLSHITWLSLTKADPPPITAECQPTNCRDQQWGPTCQHVGGSGPHKMSCVLHLITFIMALCFTRIDTPSVYEFTFPAFNASPNIDTSRLTECFI